MTGYRETGESFFAPTAKGSPVLLGFQKNGREIAKTTEPPSASQQMFLEETERHQLNVAILVHGYLSRIKSVQSRDLSVAVCAALFHDEGKTDPEMVRLLSCQEGLTEARRDQMKKHVFLSKKILLEKSVTDYNETLGALNRSYGWTLTLFEQGDRKAIEEIAEIAYRHHERFDGTGYPNGLRGQNIPFAAAVLGLADVYDAFLNPRVYKEAMPPREVWEKMHERGGKHFDSKILASFLEWQKAKDKPRYVPQSYVFTGN